MCLVERRIDDLDSWNWEGDIIVRSATVPSSRPIVGFNRRYYDIDVRQFVASEENSTIKKILSEDIEKFIKSHKHERLELFKSRRLASFDYRVQIIQDFVSENIKYVNRRGRDYWQFPEETFALKSGDCEDRAFLIASLIRASGVSPFNVRLALGKVRIKQNGRTKDFDHIWIMYKNEVGTWTLIEPLSHHDCDDLSGQLFKANNEVRFEDKDTSVSAEYIPSFLFNDRHLWAVKSPSLKYGFQHEIELRSEWSKLDPKFAGEVHRTIINSALAGLDKKILNRLNRYYSRAVKGLFGPIVDDVDRGPYDPRDHFDNSLITEGWDQVNRRLAKFQEDNEANLDAFAYAAHAIADFYAHSSYVHFANIVETVNPAGDYAYLYNPRALRYKKEPDYTSKKGFDLTSNIFTVNKAYWKGTRQDIAREWSKKIISGRYAQRDDTWPDLVSQIITEGPTAIPKDILDLPNFYKAGGPPHHSEMAVDDIIMKHTHKLYKSGGPAHRRDASNFSNQFIWRKNSAIRHIRKAFIESSASPDSLIPFHD